MATISQATRAKRRRRQDLDEKLLAVVVVIVAWVMLGAFLVQPRVAALGESRSSAKFAESQLKVLQQSLKSNPPKRVTVTPAEEARLAAALPAAMSDTAALAVVKAAASRNGVQLANPQTRPNSGDGALAATTVALQASGSRAALAAFVAELEGGVVIDASKRLVAREGGVLVVLDNVRLRPEGRGDSMILLAEAIVYRQNKKK